MPTRFQILGSSSSGNCSLIQTEDCTVLLDAGFSGKCIEAMLKEANVSLELLDAVFITHEHSDHAMGLRGLSRKNPNLKFFANEQTAAALQAQILRKLNWQIFETGTRFIFSNLEITNFSIPHDAYDPVGFIFDVKDTSTTQPQRIGWVTDLGYIPQMVQQKMANVEYLVIEANYDTELLDINPNRPWSLKQRIKGRHGHLSNEDTFEFISNNPSENWQNICLAHLSKECNDLDKLKQKFDSLNHNNSHFNIDIVDPHGNNSIIFELS